VCEGGRERWTHAHVGARADERVGDAVDELARDAKVADLDLARRVEEDVARLDVCERGRGRQDERERVEVEEVEERTDRGA